METILIVIHLMIVIALVVVVLLQRSEGGALGIGGGGGGGLMSARGAANALTRTTGVLAAAFFITSLSLGILARYGGQPTDILDRLPTTQGGGDQGGSLLDQLGKLPEEDDKSGEADQAPQADAAPFDPDAPSAAPSLPEDGIGTAAPARSTPTGDASTSTVTPAPEVPADLLPNAQNAAEEPTVPPGETQTGGAAQ